MDTIGKRLQTARDRRVWTQEDLAREAGVPVVTISRIENDRYEERPRQSTIQKLAGALKVDPAWLVFGGDSEVIEGERGKAAA